MITVMDKILYLVPTANCAVYDCHHSEYMGDGDLQDPDSAIYMRDGLFVYWNDNLDTEIPSQEALDALDLSLVQLAKIQWEEAQKVTNYETNCIVMAMYKLSGTSDFRKFLTDAGLI